MWLKLSHHDCGLVIGGDREDHEDEEEDRERSASNRTCRDVEKYVSTSEETHQAADRVAHRT